MNGEAYVTLSERPYRAQHCHLMIPRHFRIGSFVLDPRARKLSLGRTSVSLGSRAFDLLLALVSRHGGLATKDELMTEVWSGPSWTRTIWRPRFGHCAKPFPPTPVSLSDLQTVPGRGYRLVAGWKSSTWISKREVATRGDRRRRTSRRSRYRLSSFRSSISAMMRSRNILPKA